MRILISLAVGTVLLVSAAQAAPRVHGEAKLAKAVEGRVAGEPVDCIDLRAVRSSKVIDNTAIVYKAGDTLYVNRPTNGAESLDQWDALVTKTSLSRLCSVDVVHLYDSSSRMQTGTVFLAQFVPYRRPGAN